MKGDEGGDSIPIDTTRRPRAVIRVLARGHFRTKYFILLTIHGLVLFSHPPKPNSFPSNGWARCTRFRTYPLWR